MASVRNAASGGTAWHWCSRRPRMPTPDTGAALWLWANSLDDYFANLDHRRKIGVIRYVGHDLVCMRAEASLEGFYRVTEDVAHADISCRCARGATRKTLVDGVILAGLAHARLDQRHMLVAVVLMVETVARRIGVHHTHFDHALPPGGSLRARRATRSSHHKYAPMQQPQAESRAGTRPPRSATTSRSGTAVKSIAAPPDLSLDPGGSPAALARRPLG